MREYTQKETSELKNLYKLGKSMNFDKLTDDQFKDKAQNYLLALNKSKAFRKLKTNNEAVRHTFAMAQKHTKYSKAKSLNDFRLLITNLYPFRG